MINDGKGGGGGMGSWRVVVVMMVVNNDGGKGGGGITSPPHPRQVLSAHFIYFPARDLFNGFLTRPSERLRDAPLSILMILLLFKRSDCMHKVLTLQYLVNTSWTNCKKLHVALLTSWPSWLILSADSGKLSA